ncbi:MAG: hypothetical protein KDK35_07720 [Leptospiraceae bacterium]|nr:hypothetical protein [Leptospiraceae bacterium]
MRRVPAATILLALFACSANGPPFRDAPPGSPAALDGHYRFSPDLRFYRGLQLGEAYFESGRNETHFTLRFLGFPTAGGIRVRRYEGTAVEIDGRIELRSERCYLLGKRTWTDRLRPLERWDCPHIFLTLRREADGALHRMSAAYDTRSEWLGNISLVPIPASGPANFAGQVILASDAFRYPGPPPEYATGEDDPATTETLLEQMELIVWGAEGGRLLRRDQILQVESDRGTPVGQIRVLARPGDFILCVWAGDATIPITPMIAFSREGPGGLNLF